MNKIKKGLLRIKYYQKAKKLNVMTDFIDLLIERDDLEGTKDILSLIDKCNNLEDFQNRTIEYLRNKHYLYFQSSLLLGNFLGFYRFINTYNMNSEDKEYFDTFKNKNKSELIPVLRDKFYDYVMNNNEIKNELYTTDNEGNYKNFTMDFDKEYVINVFDNYTSKSNKEIVDKAKYRVVNQYLIDILGNYPVEVIKNNFNFILYDLKHKEFDMSLEERLENYNQSNEISDIDKEHLKNIDLLKTRLKSINSQESKKLMEDLNKIEGIEKDNVDELSSIYLDYEVLFRKDIIDHLYTPNNEVTIIEDYNDVKPVLIHQFFRNPEKLRNVAVERIKEEIKKVNNNNSEELSSEEQKEFERRTQHLDDAFDPTKVNYSFGNIGKHSDSMGFNWYISDSDNQISTSLLSNDYFLRRNAFGMIGIGFDKIGLKPEAIAISSPSYLTTNKGLNNLEYNEKYEFDLLSAPYSELKNKNSDTEVVLYRRNIDYDTKASYIFCTIDTSREKESKIILDKCRELSQKSHLKLVIYDIFKINKSYNDAMNEEENLKNNTNLGLS